MNMTTQFLTSKVKHEIQGFTITREVVALSVPFPFTKNDQGRHIQYLFTVERDKKYLTFNFYGSQREQADITETAPRYFRKSPKKDETFATAAIRVKKAIEKTGTKEYFANAFYCFLSDAISGEMNFDDFVNEFGYEFNSESEYIRVKNIHLACIDARKQIRKVYNGDIYELIEKLQEYETA